MSLQTKSIFINSGELLIGTADQPFVYNANITLYGAQNESGIAYDNAVIAGNKILMNTNHVRIYGQARSKMARLHKEAFPGDTSIVVDTELDWKAGDRIALAPT